MEPLLEVGGPRLANLRPDEVDVSEPKPLDEFGLRDVADHLEPEPKGFREAVERVVAVRMQDDRILHCDNPSRAFLVLKFPPRVLPYFRLQAVPQQDLVSATFLETRESAPPQPFLHVVDVV